MGTKRKLPAGVTAEAETQHVHMQPAEQEMGIGPYVGHFPSGFSPDSVIPCTWNVTVDNGQHRITGHTEAVDFVGSLEAAPPQPCRYMLGVFDRDAGVLRCSELAAGNIVRMEPRAHSLTFGPSQIGSSEKALDARQRQLANKKLVEAFGSTRRRRQLTQREGATIRADAVGGADVVEEMLAGAGERAAAENATKDEVLGRVEARRNIPPHDPAATRAQDAYRLDALIPAKCWDSVEVDRLARAATDIEYREDVLAKKGIFPKYVLHRAAVVQNPSSPEGRENLRCLAFLGYLMKLHDESPVMTAFHDRGGVGQLAKARRIQADVLAELLRLFYERMQEEGKDKYLRPREKTSLLLGYILVLALRAEGFQMGAAAFTELQAHLKLAPVSLATVFRECGCTCASIGGASQQKSYRVSLLPPANPLKRLADYFPAIKTGRAGPKR